MSSHSHPDVFRALDLSPEVLAAHGRALRGLARSLIGDSDAEDVVQETWLACLKQPGAIPERVSAWLASVTRHLAIRRIRGDARRRTRERHVAAPERLESVELRTLEREEALRAVTQALLALEEPFKSTLLLRYYEDRTPAEIAAELGLPLATVKSRLARGLERLRAKLGNELADDRSRVDRALLALAALPASEIAAGPAASVSTGLGALSLPVKLAAAAVLVLSGTAFLVHQRGERRDDPRAPAMLATVAGGAPASATTSTPDGPRGGAPVTKSEEPAQREPLAAAAEEQETMEPLPAEASFRYRISGQVRDEHDLPLAGASVYLGPRLFPLNRVAQTDAEGRFAVEFDGRRAAFDCAFTVSDGDGRASGLRALHLVAGRELVVDVGLVPAGERGSRIVQLASGELLTPAEARDTVDGSLAGTPRETTEIREHLTVMASLLRSRLELLPSKVAKIEGAPECDRRADGSIVFVESAPSLDCTRPQREFRRRLLLEAQMAFRESREYRRVYGELVVVDELDVPAEPPARVRGVVRDTRGNPIAGALVGWNTPGEPVERRVTSGADGAFVLEDVWDGPIVLRAGGGDHGVARNSVELAPGQELAWDPVLERGDEVTGRIVLDDSVEERAADGLGGLRIELWSSTPTSLWCDATFTNADGRFAIPNVPAGALELHVYAAGTVSSPLVFPASVVRPVFAGTDLGDLPLAAAVLAPHACTVALLDPDGAPLPGAEVRVWHVASGAGIVARTADEEGRLVLAGLPNGAYRVEVGGPFGWRDLGEPWIDEDLVLPDVRFAPPGYAELELAPDAGLTCSLWSTDAEVLGRLVRTTDARTLLALPAGRYLACAQGRVGRTEAVLEVRSGETSGIAFDVADGLRARSANIDPVVASETRCNDCHKSARTEERVPR